MAKTSDSKYGPTLTALDGSEEILVLVAGRNRRALAQAIANLVPAVGGTVTSVALAAPGDGLSVTGGPITEDGEISIALADDLAALEALAGTGFARRTGADTWALVALGTAAPLDADADTTLAANSDTRLSTQKAVKAYIDAIVTGGASDVMIFKSALDCSANPNYPAADAGHVYKVSVAGKIGGATGTPVEAGDTLYCIADATPAGTQAAVGASWNISQVNIDGAVTGPASASDGGIVLFDGPTGKLIKAGTLSDVLDLVGGAARGDILYRGNAGWVRLPAGTAGLFLKTMGAGADPQWAAGGGITLGTPQNATSGESLDFTGIPAGVTQVNVMFWGVSINGSAQVMVQIGDAGGIEASGYAGVSSIISSSNWRTSLSAGFIVDGTADANTRYGCMTLNLLDANTNTWVASGAVGLGDAAVLMICGGGKSLSGALDRVRITTDSGTATFDGGKINISYK